MFDLELTLLRGLGRFKDVDTSKLKLMAMAGERIEVEADEALLEEGHASDCVYIVLAGDADVTRTINGVTTQLSHIAKGDIVGEIGVVLRQPRVATLTARTPMTVLRLDGRTYMDLLQQVPQLAIATIRDLSERLVEASDRLAQGQADAAQSQSTSARPKTPAAKPATRKSPVDKPASGLPGAHAGKR
jgi:CRP/FNR family transcriptional regulator, cyclic AMP receptor protein